MTNTPDTSPEAVTLCAATCLLLDGRFVREADYRALSAERDELKQSLEKAVLACGEQARARGEAEGKLAASEMAGVVDGWKARAEAAEVEQLEQSRLLGMSAERELSLRTKLEAAEAERDALKAELALAVGALQNIESRPDKMTWGEDYEVSEAMRDMEETARAFLARRQKRRSHD